MATGDFQDLYTRTIYAAQRDTNVAADVLRAKEAVNEAYLSLCDSGPQWSFLTVQGTQTLVTNQSTYSYATIATSLGVTGITNVLSWSFGGPAGSASGHYARWEDFWAIKQLNPSLAAGVPHLWTTYGRAQVDIWPKPQSGYSATVLAVRKAAELVGNSDTTLIPQGWVTRLLVPAAAAILLRQEGGSEAVSEANNNEAAYKLVYEQFAAGPMVLAAPVSQPTQAHLLLPSGLKGVSGSFLEIAQRVCYDANVASWMSYNLTRAKEAVNAVYRTLLDTPDPWDFLEREGQVTITAGQGTYTIDSFATALGVPAIRQILNVVNDSTDNADPLEAMGWPELESLTKSTQDGEAADIPAAFAIWDSKIRFWPPPLENYNLGIYYILGTAEMSADADVPVVPGEWVHEVLVPLAAARLLYQSNEAPQIQKGQLLEARGQAQLKLMREARAASKQPTLRLQSPRFSADLAGSYTQDWYF